MKSDLKIQNHHRRVVETAISVLNESGNLGEGTREKLEIALRGKFAGIRSVNLVNGNLIIGIERKEDEIGVPQYISVESHIWPKQANLKPEIRELLKSKNMIESNEVIPANDAHHPDQLDKAS